MVRQPPGFGFGRTGRRMDRKMFRQGTFLLQVCLSAGSSLSLAIVLTLNLWWFV